MAVMPWLARCFQCHPEGAGMDGTVRFTEENLGQYPADWAGLWLADHHVHTGHTDVVAITGRDQRGAEVRVWPAMLGITAARRPLVEQLAVLAAHFTERCGSRPLLVQLPGGLFAQTLDTVFPNPGVAGGGHDDAPEPGGSGASGGASAPS